MPASLSTVMKSIGLITHYETPGGNRNIAPPHYHIAGPNPIYPCRDSNPEPLFTANGRSQLKYQGFV